MFIFMRCQNIWKVYDNVEESLTEAYYNFIMLLKKSWFIDSQHVTRITSLESKPNSFTYTTPAFIKKSQVFVWFDCLSKSSKSAAAPIIWAIHSTMMKTEAMHYPRYSSLATDLVRAVCIYLFKYNFVRIEPRWHGSEEMGQTWPLACDHLP